MEIACTLTGNMYRYSFGNYNPWTLPFEPGQSVEMTAGQNDRASFQILLYHGEDMMTALDENPALHPVWPLPVFRVLCSLPEESGINVSLSLVEDVRDDDGNYKGEILSSCRMKYQERLRVQQIWAELEIPEDTAPGLYRGEIKIYECRMFGDERLCALLPFSVEVLPVRLPALRDAGFGLDLWQHHTSLARTYEAPLWGEEHFALMERYAERLARLGQAAVTIVASEAPWSGQWSAWYRTNPSDVFEYNMIRIKKDKNGRFSYDFSVMDCYIRMCMAHGINREIEIFGLAGVWTMPDAGFDRVTGDGEEAIRVRYMDEESGCLRYMRKRAEVEAYLTALDAELVKNGWAHIARAAVDEPADSDAFRRTLEWLGQCMPHVKFKVTICSSRVLRDDYDRITDCVVNLPLLFGEKELVKKLKEKYHLSFYTAMEPPHPNSFLSCRLCEVRFLPWLSLILGMDGFLRWAAWLFPNNPFDWESYHYQKFRAGGMQFLYPGKDGRPLESLRFKQLEQGIRDSMILREYEKKTGKKSAEEAGRILKLPAGQIGGCRDASEFMETAQESFDGIIKEALYVLAEKEGKNGG